MTAFLLALPFASTSPPYGRIPKHLEFAFESGWGAMLPHTTAATATTVRHQPPPPLARALFVCPIPCTPRGVAGGSDGRTLSFNYSDVRWPSPQGHTQLQVRVSHTACGYPVDHYFFGEAEANFGLEWDACGYNYPCKPFSQVMDPTKSTAMAFGLIDPLPSTWLRKPTFAFPQNGSWTKNGSPCAHVSNLTTRCGGGPCWHLPGDPKTDLFDAAHCAGIGGPRGIDWCAVTDLCFSENVTDPTTLPPWESLVGISFSHLKLANQWGHVEGFIPVKDVVVGKAAAPLPGVCGYAFGPPIMDGSFSS